MKVLAVDDERPMLTALQKAISASPDVKQVTEFNSCTKALEWAKDNSIDIAFLDISMRGMGGMMLAEKLQELQPECKIVFCTGYTRYAVDAFQIHASGYLMKPITPEAVQKELNYIKGQKEKEKHITIKCFGNFETYCDGRPISFQRRKTKELLAYLVDCNGSGVTTRQICAKLWEGKLDDTKNLNYLYQLFSDLTGTLRELHQESIFIRANGYYSIDTQQVECDYYQYLETGEPAFRGEYMSQYSWAEETCGMLLGKEF
ncbi:MAG: response regulator [Lachnospiraceae bacterium]